MFCTFLLTQPLQNPDVLWRNGGWKCWRCQPERVSQMMQIQSISFCKTFSPWFCFGHMTWICVSGMPLRRLQLGDANGQKCWKWATRPSVYPQAPSWMREGSRDKVWGLKLFMAGMNVWHEMYPKMAVQDMTRNQLCCRHKSTGYCVCYPFQASGWDHRLSGWHWASIYVHRWEMMGRYSLKGYLGSLIHAYIWRCCVFMICLSL